jgi:hypothetical protein
MMAEQGTLLTLKGLNYIVASLCLWLVFVEEYGVRLLPSADAECKIQDAEGHGHHNTCQSEAPCCKQQGIKAELRKSQPAFAFRATARSPRHSSLQQVTGYFGEGE